jgi:Flp pilus assembly pilin Flp
MKQSLFSSGFRRGQSMVEYMLAVSVLAIGLAACWALLGDGVRGGFDAVRTTVQMPYP